MVELLIVVQAVAGSSPVDQPKQRYGVTVALLILIQSAKVRILVALPTINNTR